jgi:hypothetical protein
VSEVGFGCYVVSERDDFVPDLSDVAGPFVFMSPAARTQNNTVNTFYGVSRNLIGVR